MSKKLNLILIKVYAFKREEICVIKVKQKEILYNYGKTEGKSVYFTISIFAAMSFNLPFSYD